MDPVTAIVAVRTSRKVTRWLVVGIAGVVVLGLGTTLIVLGSVGQRTAGLSDCGGDDLGDAVPVSTITGPVDATGEQRRNAATIMTVGRQLGVPRRGWVVAIATARQESGLRNLDGGHSDSAGLFQQRPSQGWGTLDQVRDPGYAARAFYRRLTRIPGWQQLPLTVAAQRVQRSAFPDAYADDESAAEALVSGGETAGDGHTRTAASTTTYHLGDVKPQTAALVDALAPMFGVTDVGGYRASARDPGGHPSGLAADFMIQNRDVGDRLSAYARRHAAELGVDYIIWRQRIWSTDRAADGWRPMADRGSPTENHLDHVHINVEPGASTESLATPADVECDAGLAFAGGGAVVFPLPSGSGYRDLHNYGGSGSHWARGHTGTDLSVGCGTPVLAAHGGTVQVDTTAGWAGRWLVKVQAGPGQLTTWYAHMQALSVQAGEAVQAGQRIGSVGSEGNSTGCHLHFEVHPHGGSIYGDGVDPSSWLAAHVGRPLAGGTTIQAASAAGRALGLSVGAAAFPAGGFRLATFNVLGAQYTKPGGKNAGMAGGQVRTARQLRLLDRYRADVVGMQEAYPGNWRAFTSMGGHVYDTWPRVGRNTRNTIAWRRSSFELVQATWVRVPYVNGRLVKDPAVLLRQRSTGRTAWFLNVHNPADTGSHARQQRWRDHAIRAERDLLHRLTRSTGRPAFLTGDFNDAAQAYCPMTSGGTMIASAGGHAGAGCRAPGEGVDWIFGAGRVAFSASVRDLTPRQAGMSDHPIVVANAHIG